jgi:two-component system cell cycle response regulator DivK
VSAAAGVGKQVLLVEDDAISLRLMRDVLEAQGYRTEQTTNGLDAFSAAQRLRPDLIVLDIGLPGMDGVEVTRKLKAEPQLSHIPVLAVSAYAMPADEERLLKAGGAAYLTKPLSFVEFVRVVNSLLGPID